MSSGDSTDAEKLGSLVADAVGDLAGLPPHLAGTAFLITAALIRLVRSDGDSLARQEALMSMAEEAKAALDREKFPDQG